MKLTNIALEINDEPPYETNGNVMPFVGNIFKLEEIFIIVWKINILAKPVSEFKIKKLFVFCEIINVLK